MDDKVRYILQQLATAKARVWLQGEELKVSAPQGAMTPALAGQIKAAKAGIVAWLKAQQEANSSEQLPTASKKGAYTLSNAQKRIWVLSQDKAESIKYNLAGALSIKGQIDATILAAAWKSLVQKHEALRTRFTLGDEGVTQQYLSPEEPALQLNIHLGDKSYKDHKFIQNYIAQSLNQAFDLSTGPLVEAHLFPLSTEQTVLYYKVHHIIADGWSLDVLWADLFKAYTEIAGGREADTSLPHQYKDFAEWQHQALHSEQFKKHSAFWQEHLSGDLPSLNLPEQEPQETSQVQAGASASYKQQVNADHIAALEDLARQEHASLFMAFIASVNTLLYHYTRQEDILLGTPVSGRDQFDLAGQIGLYANTLVLRNQVQGTRTFREQLQQVKQNSLRAFEHQAYPFDLLVADLNIDREQAENPIFQVLIEYQANNPATQGQMQAGLEIAPFGEAKELAKVDITFNLTTTGAYNYINTSYRADKYSAQLIEQLTAHLISLLEQVATSPDQAIASLPLLSKEQQHLLLNQYNDTHQPHAIERAVLSDFESWVEKDPERPAIKMQGEAWTYKQLDERANSIAHYLLQRGVVKNSIIGICLQPSLHRISLIYGIIKAGAAYLPLATDLPAARQEKIIQSSGLELILTDKQSHALFTAPVEVARAEDIYEQAGNTTAPALSHDPAALAYVIYTSGSTGNPKGVKIDCKALVNRIDWMQKEYPINTEDVILHKTVYTFDVSVWELFWFARHGACLSILPGGEEKLPDRIISQIEEDQVTVMHFVPAMLNGFLHYTEATGEASKINSLRYVFASGEALTPASVNHFYTLTQNTETRLINLYGPTEAAIDVTWYICEPHTEHRLIPIGRPVDNTNLYVLGDHMQLMPPGTVGELYIGGVQVAQGYLHAPELTAAAFKPSPFTATDTLYATGDLVRWNEKGQLLYHGRKDNQVKIRGFRIELGEIEKNLEQIEGITHAAVLLIKDKGINSGLIAYISGEQPPAPEQISDLLARKLPGYMIPQQLIVLPEMPLSANGKINRKALPQPTTNSKRQESKQEQPTGTKEQVLATAWQQVLGTNRIYRDTNYFNAGGDSIKAILIVSRLKKQGWTIHLPEMLKAPVLSQQAQKLSRVTRIPSQKEVNGLVPLNAIQQEFLYDTRQPKHHFNQSVLLDVADTVTATQLQQALTQLCAHHDQLRAVYHHKEGTWIQELLPSAHFTVDVGIYDAPASEEERVVLYNKLQGSLNLSKAPLICCALLKGHKKQQVLLIMHHLLVDAVSWRIILEDLETLTSQLQLGNTPELPPRTDSFAYWQQVLGKTALPTAPAASQADNKLLPPDHPQGSNREQDTHTSSFSLSEQETSALISKLSLLRVEFKSVIIAALLQSAKNHTAAPITLHLEGHGREQVEDLDITRTVAWFTSIYPFTPEAEQSAGPARYIKDINQQLQALPTRAAKPAIQIEDEEQPSGQREILFNYLGEFATEHQTHEGNALFSLSGESRGHEAHPERQRMAELEFSGMIAGGRLHMNILYSAHRYEAASIDQFSQHYAQTLRDYGRMIAALDAPSLAPYDFYYPALRDQQLAQLLSHSDIEELYPMLPLQKGMYHNWLLHPQDHTNHCQYSYSIAGALDQNRLAVAFADCHQHHQALRTSFSSRYGDLIQIIHKTAAVDYCYHTPATEQVEAFVARYKKEDLSRGFDLEQAPLIRLAVIKTGPQQYQVIWSCHHIILDGWSLVSLIQECNQRYAQAVKGEKDLALPGATYADYFDWYATYPLPEARHFWQNYLGGDLLGSGIPAQAQEQGIDTYTLAARELILDSTFTSRINDYCRNHEITQNAFFQAAWALQLSLYHKQEQVLFGTVHAGRPPAVEGIEQMLGLFINTIPVRVKVSATASLPALLRQVHADFLQAQPYQYLPYQEILASAALGSESIDHILLFQNYYVAEQASQSMGEGDLRILQMDTREQNAYDLVLIITSGKKITCSFEYNAGVYTQAQIDLLAQRFEQVLNGLLQASGADTKDLAHLFADTVAGEHTPLSRKTRACLQVTTRHAAPETETEKRLHAIWQDLLQVDTLSVEDDFFLIGGDSIISIKAIVAINQALQVQLPVAALYEHRSIRALAAYIEEGAASQDDGEQKQLLRKEIADWSARILPGLQELYPGLEKIYPMTAIERGMLFDSLLSTKDTYHIQEVFSIEDTELRPDLLEQALQILARKHAILRTAYRLDDDWGGIHLVQKEVPVNIRVTDLSELSAQAQTDYIKDNSARNLTQPFAWEDFPMWRMSLFTLAPRQHRVLWEVHHALMDGWSSKVLFGELHTTYSALSRDEEASHDTLAASYEDAVTEQLSIERDQRQEEFWQHYMQGYQKPELFARPLAEQEEHQLVLSAADSERLQSLALEQEVQLRVLLMNTLLHVLKAHIYQQDYCLGIVGNIRPQLADSDKLLGCFLNSTPLRLPLGEEQETKEAISKELIKVKAWDQLPLGRIIKVAAGTADAGNPLFDILFNYNDFGNAQEQLDQEAEENDSSLRGYSRTNSKMDLSVNVGKYIIINFAFNAVIKSLGGNQELVRQYEQALQHLISTGVLPQSVDAFPALPPVQRPKSLYAAFEEVTRQHSSALALHSPAQELTYEGLLQAVEQQAAWLAAQGLAPGDIVAVSCEAREAYVLSFWSLQHRGAIYLPLDPALPESRKQLIIQESGAHWLLTDCSPDFVSNQTALRILSYEQSRQSVAEVPEPVPSTADSPVYLIFTSGSTGIPKGVQLSGRGLLNLQEIFTNKLSIGAGDKVLQFASPSFDASVWEFVMALLTGASLHIPAADIIPDADRFTDFLTEQEITCMTLPPVYLQNLSYNSKLSLRLLITAGSSPQQEIIKQWLPHLDYINAYGPTETSICAAMEYLPQGTDLPQNLAIGKALDNTFIAILNEAGGCMAAGAEGEIVVTGENLALGYQQQPAGAARFITLQHTKQRAYKTGDFGYYDTEGKIHFTGRRDKQVKVRGHRIELAGIESVALQLPGIAQVAAIVQNQQILIAFQSATDQTQSLQQHFRETLPAYMQPAYIAWLRELPVTHSGKINEGALLRSITQQRSQQQGPVLALSGLEKQIAALWKETLGLQEVHPQANFFDLGGDSIKLMQLHKKLQEMLETRFPLVMLFQYPTVSSMATFYLQHKDGKKEDRTEAIKKGQQLRDKRKALRSRRK